MEKKSVITALVSAVVGGVATAATIYHQEVKDFIEGLLPEKKKEKKDSTSSPSPTDKGDEVDFEEVK